jgi:hypothetical protein
MLGEAEQRLGCVVIAPTRAFDVDGDECGLVMSLPPCVDLSAGPSLWL